MATLEPPRGGRAVSWSILGLAASLPAYQGRWLFVWLNEGFPHLSLGVYFLIVAAFALYFLFAVPALNGGAFARGLEAWRGRGPRAGAVPLAINAMAWLCYLAAAYKSFGLLISTFR